MRWAWTAAQRAAHARPIRQDFLDALNPAYRRNSLLARTIIIGDVNAAPPR